MTTASSLQIVLRSVVSKQRSVAQHIDRSAWAELRRRETAAGEACACCGQCGSCDACENCEARHDRT